ncbi:dethiobiotin synthase [Herminiimonas arsenitoxidans]|uniref:dethiobiotin synthase n=1 Tax=Herminiimonas arsenitoxidans TaxID=1809410 RepID=UPI000970C244|nr:dethiobiotin synthase [Herminiimonas arsenitoxidans]
MTATFNCFVTGTDTEIGKTMISTALLHALVERGVRAAAIKSVAAGATAIQTSAGQVWHNDDADALAQAANVVLPPKLATPYLLHEAAAPHVSAKLQGVSIDIAHIKSCYAQVRELADAVVVEGVGGFRVPLSDHADTADLAQELGLPVIMVVGLRLGCLNHALLTADAIAARGLKLVGWVANTVDAGMAFAEDNVEALVARLPAPLLGCVPRLAAPLPAAAASYLDFSCLPNWPKA